jgi:60 kDa SS-A/Ro ribonucleoprotein
MLKKEMSSEEVDSFLKISDLATDLYVLQTTELNEQDKVGLVSRGNLQREHIPTEWLQNDKVYEALAKNMPLTATIRNLVAMSMRGLLTEDSDLTKIICEKLENEEALKKARIHPIQILLAMKHYETGSAAQGLGPKRRVNNWVPSHRILLALNSALNKSFGCIEPTGRKIVVGVDFSGSMTFKNVNGYLNLNARNASLAMAMAHVNSEPDLMLLAFSDGSHGPLKKGYWPLEIRKGMSLDQVIKYADSQDNGGTDGSKPIMWALENKIRDIDAFVLYTDNETWSGQQHVVEALSSYRHYYNKNCKLIVAGTTATASSIRNQNDVLSLDCAGFDANLPQAINSFILM